MASVYFNGSTEGFIAELIKSEKLSSEELLELKDLAGTRSLKKNHVKNEGGNNDKLD